MPDPPASSWPDQVTVKLPGLKAGKAWTLLVGPAASMVTRACLAGSTPWLGSFSFTWSVVMGALMSKVTVATLRICVPVGRLVFGRPCS